MIKIEETGCGGLILALIINLTAGGWSVDVILSWFGKDIPAFFDVLIGLLAGEFSIPIAIIGKILIACGVF